MAASGDIVYPKLDPLKDMIPFDAVLKDMLADMGLGCRACSSSEEAKAAMRDLSNGYPCEFFGSDTSGEKSFEEFFTEADERDETSFANLGVVKNSRKRPVAEVEAIFASLRDVFGREGATKADIVGALKDYLPDFHHIEKGRGLDSRM